MCFTVYVEKFSNPTYFMQVTRSLFKHYSEKATLCGELDVVEIRTALFFKSSGGFHTLYEEQTGSKNRNKSEKNMSIKPNLSSRRVSSKNRPSTKPLKASKAQAVIRVSRLPHEFSEKEIRQLFGQFGRIVKLRLSRSSRTGRSRGFAFLQYELPEISKIAAEATNNYFIGGHPIKVEGVAPESVLPSYFRGSNRKPLNERTFLERKSKKIRAAHNSTRHYVVDHKSAEKDTKRNARLAESGIEYDFSRKVIARK